MSSFKEQMEEHRDNAYQIAGSIVEHLASVSEGIGRLLGKDTLQYQKLIGNTGAAATVTLSASPPPGVDWLIERFACVSGAGGTLDFYLDEVQPQNLVEYQGSAAKNSWGAAKAVYVPGGRVLYAVFAGLAPDTVCTINMRVVELARETGVSSNGK